MKTEVEEGQERANARPMRFVIETREDYALALERIKALVDGPKDRSGERELAALKKAVEKWDSGQSRKHGYPM